MKRYRDRERELRRKWKVKKEAQATPQTTYRVLEEVLAWPAPADGAFNDGSGVRAHGPSRGFRRRPPWYTINPMKDGLKAANPICGAWGRQAQRPCRRAPMRGRRRCRLHGGANPGGIPGNQNAVTHGRRTKAATIAKRERAAAAKAAVAKVEQVVAEVDAAIADAAAGKRKRRPK
jgi:hypothetical protein